MSSLNPKYTKSIGINYLSLGGLSDVPPNPDNSYGGQLDPAQQALAYAVATIGGWVNKGVVYMPFLDEDAKEAWTSARTVQQTIDYDKKDEKIVGYELNDYPLDQWIEIFEKSESAARELRRIFAKNIENGYPMPKAGRQFAALLVKGKLNPSPPPKKKTLLHRDTLLSGVCKRVMSVFNLPLGATKTVLSQEKPPVTGCTVAAAAMFGLGVPVNFPRADTICRRNDLPVDILENLRLLDSWDKLPVNSYSQAIPPDELRADPFKRHKQAFQKAATRLGRPLPVSLLEQ